MMIENRQFFEFQVVDAEGRGRVDTSVAPPAPVTFTVTSWSSPRSPLIEGPPCHAPNARAIPSLYLERVIDHVLEFRGYYCATPDGVGRQPIPCTRSTVRAMLITDPALFAQVRRAIETATTATKRRGGS